MRFVYISSKKNGNFEVELKRAYWSIKTNDSDIEIFSSRNFDQKQPCITFNFITRKKIKSSEVYKLRATLTQVETVNLRGV